MNHADSPYFTGSRSIKIMLQILDLLVICRYITHIKVLDSLVVGGR